MKYTALGVAEGAIKGNVHASGQACVMVWLGENSTVEGNVVYDALGNMVFKNVVGGEPKDPAEIGEFAGVTINGDLEMRDGFLSASGVSLKNHVVGRVICDGGRPKKLPSSRDDWDGDGRDDGRIDGNYECMAADLEPEPLKFSVVDVMDLPDLLDFRGQSTLVRTDRGVMGSFNASGLEPGVWTWWWVFYNNPDACQNPKFVGMGSQMLFPQVAQSFAELVGQVERLVDLYNRDLADGLDSLMALLPKGDSEKSVEPFSLDVSALDELIEQPAKHETGYLVDMAKVEALDTMGENRKAVELLNRYISKDTTIRV